MLELGYLVGVMNGPLKLLTAHKILPLLDLLAKFKRVLGMLANTCKDHSSPLLVTGCFELKSFGYKFIQSRCKFFTLA